MTSIGRMKFPLLYPRPSSFQDLDMHWWGICRQRGEGRKWRPRAARTRVHARHEHRLSTIRVLRAIHTRVAHAHPCVPACKRNTRVSVRCVRDEEKLVNEVHHRNRALEKAPCLLPLYLRHFESNTPRNEGRFVKHKYLSVIASLLVPFWQFPLLSSTRFFTEIAGRGWSDRNLSLQQYVIIHRCNVIQMTHLRDESALKKWVHANIVVWCNTAFWVISLVVRQHGLSHLKSMNSCVQKAVTKFTCSSTVQQNILHRISSIPIVVYRLWRFNLVCLSIFSSYFLISFLKS